MVDIDKGILSAFKIYDETKYRNFEKTGIKYDLLSPNDRFLPFIFKRPSSAHEIKEIRVVDITGAIIYTVANASTVVSVYESDTITEDWVMYFGAQIVGMVLPCSYYSLEIEDFGGHIVYSEHFAPQTNAELSKLIKLEFWNDSNIGNVIYEFGYRNILYFDSVIVNPLPKLNQTKRKDGNDNVLPSFMKAYLEYTFDLKTIPFYLMKLLNTIDMNENIILSNPSERYEKPKDFTLFGNWINKGKEFRARMSFLDCEVIKTGCEEASDFRILGTPAPGNQVPVITNLYIVGAPFSLNPNPFIPLDLSNNPAVGKISTLTFNYFDAEGDLAGLHLYRWQINSGAGFVDIPNATEEIYTPINAHFGDFLRCGVTPVALTGNSPGVEVFSPSAYVTGGLTAFDVTLSLGSGAITGGDVPITLDISPISSSFGSAFITVDAGNHGVYSKYVPINAGDSQINTHINIISNSGDTVQAVVSIQTLNSVPGALYQAGTPDSFTFSFDPNVMG